MRLGDDRSARLARAFRAALTALSEPGRVVAIEPPGDAAPGLSPAASALIATLVDADAPLWIAPSQKDAETTKALRFATSSAPTDAPETAEFLVGRWDSLAPLLDELRIGDAERPDRSATLIVEADAVSEGVGPGRAGRVSGPGAPEGRVASVAGVDDRFWPFIDANARRYPLGIDLFVTAGDRVLGLPRSISAAPAETV